MYSRPLFMQATTNPNTPAKQTAKNKLHIQWNINTYFLWIVSLDISTTNKTEEDSGILKMSMSTFRMNGFFFFYWFLSLLGSHDVLLDDII